MVHELGNSQTTEKGHGSLADEKAKNLLAGVRKASSREEQGVSNATAYWLNSLNRKAERHKNSPRKIHFTKLGSSQSTLVYQLSYPDDWNAERGGQVIITPCRIERSPTGQLSLPIPVNLKRDVDESLQDLVPISEINRLNALIHLSKTVGSIAIKPFFVPEKDYWRKFIDDLLGEESVIWEDQMQPLAKGEELDVEAFWLTLGNGHLETGIRTVKTQRPVAIIACEPPIYVLPEEGIYGEARIELPPGISLSDWATAPTIAPSEISTVREKLGGLTVKELPPKKKKKRRGRAKAHHDRPRPALPKLPETRVVKIDGKTHAPKGRLVLKRTNIVDPEVQKRYPFLQFGGKGIDTSAFPLAELQFKYGGAIVDAPFSTPAQCRVFSKADIAEVSRDLAAEKDLLLELFSSGLMSIHDLELKAVGISPALNGAFGLTAGPNLPERWTQFCTRQIPVLEASGWLIEIDPSFYFQVVSPDSWYADLGEQAGKGSEMLAFDYGIEYEGKKISLIKILAQLLANQQKGFDPRLLLEADEDHHIPVFLNDEGLMLPVPARRLGQIYTSLTELLNLESKGISLHPLRAAQLVSDFGINSFDDSSTVQRLRELGNKIRDFRGIQPVAPPEALEADLRSYQKEGLSWLQFLRESQLNGILADDMGLGKTVQTLACIQVEKAEGRLEHPALIVAPTSVISNWVSEAARFTPSLKVLLLHGMERIESFGEIQNYDLVVTSYPLLSRDIKCHLGNKYHYAILDEAQVIKNPKSKVARNACQLKAKHRLCLTGTPMENHLGELWSLIHFLMPGFLGTYDVFRKHWQRPIENDGDSFRRERLVSKITPILLRRTKDLVLKELPPRTDMVHEVSLDKAQATLYESVRAAMDKRVRDALKDKGLNRSHIIVLDALLKLRQICCHPRLLKTDSAKSVKQSAKLEAFEELVASQVEAGRRILVFSQFTSMIEIIEESLDKLKIGYVKLTGSTRDRKEVIDRFQNKEVPVFLISLKAGGSGLNLTAADCVIHYDPWWNPAVEEQATARAHRMGQDNPVFVYRLVTKGTIEERILELQKKKGELAKAVLSGGKIDEEDGSMKAMTQSDLEMLLAPMDQEYQE